MNTSGHGVPPASRALATYKCCTCGFNYLSTQCRLIQLEVGYGLQCPNCALTSFVPVDPQCLGLEPPHEASRDQFTASISRDICDICLFACNPPSLPYYMPSADCRFLNRELQTAMMPFETLLHSHKARYLRHRPAFIYRMR